ncbi:MAG: energy transducer TonB [Paracoccaceae bacterium]
MMVGAVQGMQWNTGQKASAVLHGGLILWVMLFDLFAAPDDPMIPETTEVTIVTAADFARIMEPQSATTPPPAPEPAPPPPAPPRSEPIAAPAPITPPPPVTEPDATSERPQAAVVAPVVTPQASLRPVQRQADRVAPTPAPTPDPQVAIAPRDQSAVTPDAAETIDAQEAQEATQRAAAATETVTEVTQISETEPARRTATAPEVSLRPQRRPRPPAPAPAEAAPVETAAPAPQPAPEPSLAGPSSSAVEDALAQALASALPDLAPAALSAADADMLRLSIEACWNVGFLSTEALQVVVTIAFEMTTDARPIDPRSARSAADGGTLVAQRTAFEAGRQAIMQCGANGFGLPVDLYDQWQSVEITFNPARMSTR